MDRFPSRTGFTLIELLVVIAIISILAAGISPAIATALDRSRVLECRSHLTHVALALRMYYSDQGGYPPDLAALVRTGFITDDTLIRCTKTGAEYYYQAPKAGGGPEALVAACVDPATAQGQRPHSFRNSLLLLQRGGKVAEVGR